MFTPFTQITWSVHVMDYSKRAAYISRVYLVGFLSKFTHALEDMERIKNDVAAGNRQMPFPKSVHPLPRDSFRFRDWYRRNRQREENYVILCDSNILFYTYMLHIRTYSMIVAAPAGLKKVERVLLVTLLPSIDLPTLGSKGPNGAPRELLCRKFP